MFKNIQYDMLRNFYKDARKNKSKKEMINMETALLLKK